MYEEIAINQHGDVLDGHHRLKACRELGIIEEPVFAFASKEFDNEIEGEEGEEKGGA